MIDILLKTQLQRLQQKSTFRSYQELMQQYRQLQKQSNKMRVEIEQLRISVKELKNREVYTQRVNYGKLMDINSAVKDGKKFALGRENYLDGDISPPQEYQSNSHYIRSNSTQNNNTSFQFQQQPPTTNFISPDYMYNDLLTVESQKSHQQLQSQIQLGYNFSFMPRPLKRNISALQILQNSNNNNDSKRVTFDINEDKILFTSASYKQMINNSNKEIETPNFAALSQQSLLYGQENVGQVVIQRKQLLNGLKKLPNKPERNHRTSNYSINISDS